MSRTDQTALSRDPNRRQVAEPHRDGRRATCPDCGSYVGPTKSGGKPLPNTDATCFGWSCEPCSLTLPSNCHGPAAPSFIDTMAGLEVEFRAGHSRYVPVPKRFVEEGDRSDE